MPPTERCRSKRSCRGHGPLLQPGGFGFWSRAWAAPAAGRFWLLVAGMARSCSRAVLPPGRGHGPLLQPGGFGFWSRAWPAPAAGVGGGHAPDQIRFPQAEARAHQPINSRSAQPQRSAAQSIGSTFGKMNPHPITPSTFTSAATMKAMV